MLFSAVFIAIVGVLAASNQRTDGTIACDPALRPVQISVDGTTFSSGVFPYSPDQYCSYLFTAQANDEVILDFTNFELEDCLDCGCDYIKVYDGTSNTAPLLTTVCGAQTAFSVVASSNAFLEFVSDSSVNVGGFEGTFTSGNAACTGGVVYTALNGTFSTPNYPLNYPLLSSCSWTLSPPAGPYVVEIWFNDFSLENSCSFDTVDMLDSTGARINKWWGTSPNDAAARFISYEGTGDVTVSFSSDSSISDNGFQAQWQFVQIGA